MLTPSPFHLLGLPHPLLDLQLLVAADHGAEAEDEVPCNRRRILDACRGVQFGLRPLEILQDAEVEVVRAQETVYGSNGEVGVSTLERREDPVSPLLRPGDVGA